MNGATGRVTLYTYDAGSVQQTVAYTGTALDDGNWHHYCAICTTGTLKQWVDSTAAGTATATIVIGNGGGLNIGNGDDQRNYFTFDGGSIDEFAVWDASVAETIPAKLYNSGTGAFRIP
jgi:hypothetical protein